MYEMNMLEDVQTVVFTNLIMLFALFMLVIMSRFIVRVVGRIYVSKDGKGMIVSHLNFLGKRKDIKFSVDDVMPITTVEEMREKFFKIRFKNLDGL